MMWIVTNSFVERWLTRVPEDRKILLRYEDFVGDTAMALSRVSRLVGVDYEEVARRLREGEELEVGHTVAGNRVRMQGRIRLRPDTEWRSALTGRDRELVESICRVRLERYGYRT